MGQVETNVFRILNLDELQSQYRRFRIRGLTSDQVEYDRNVQTLTRDLSQRLKSPVTVIEDEGKPYLIVSVDSGEPPSPIQVSNATAYFESTPDITTLDYVNPVPGTEQICLRFLQFMINGTFYRNQRYWQPSSGYPQFEREPTASMDGINIYRGHSVRVVHSEADGFGVCVDVTHKYVSRDPISRLLAVNSFAKVSGMRCVYHYGLAWYEIRPTIYSGLTVGEQLLEAGANGAASLFDFIVGNAPKPFPREVADLSPESPAVGYTTQFEARLVYRDQSGALNESLSDVFGSLVKQRKLGHTAQQADWIIGAGLFTSNVNGQGIRSMSTPGTAYDDPVLGKDPQPGHMNDFKNVDYDNGGVHINSGIPNHAFYIVANEIGGHAWEKAGNIWYVALRDRLRAKSDFQDAANMTYAVARQLFGAGSLEQQAVRKGWSDVGINVVEEREDDGGGSPPKRGGGCLLAVPALLLGAVALQGARSSRRRQ